MTDGESHEAARGLRRLLLDFLFDARGGDKAVRQMLHADITDLCRWIIQHPESVTDGGR